GSPPTGALVTGLFAWHSAIPAGDVTVEGVDYRITVDDGYSPTSTPTWYTTVPNARVAQRYAAVADTYVSGAHGAEEALSVSASALGRDTALLRFDTSDIPVRHTVAKAVLKLRVSGDAGLDTGVVQVTGAWSESS